ncbi:MAG: hypothetical protein N5P05_001380 [Chroococcopsis gigantea SAG 12.99]|jgi:hypothetical protein|nr:hypothetical protein [Chlorogloea purpurea SAG 13.99]MDV2999774.1 hypothetical protein [Chroococcopsis gigantea SAG 12.99]
MKFILDIIQDYKFLLGLGLSVPLAILANLLTPKVDKILSDHNSKLKQKRIKKLRAEYQQVKIYVEDKQAYIEFLLIYLVKALVLGFLIIFWSLLIYSLPIGSLYANFFSRLFILFGSIIIVNLGLKTLDTYQNVKAFKDYQISLSSILEDKERIN